MGDVADPVLDGADGRYFLTQLQQRVLRIALPGCERILKDNQRQVGGVSDALEMSERHLRRLPKGERRWRKHQKRGGAALSRHARKPRRLDATVGPDAIDQRQFGADLFLRNL